MFRICGARLFVSVYNITQQSRHFTSTCFTDDKKIEKNAPEKWRSTRSRTGRTCRTSRTGGLVCNVPIDNNKTSRIARAKNTADWKKQYSQYSRYSWNKVPCFTKLKKRRQAVISREAATSRMSGDQPDDMRNSQRRHSATHAVSSRRDDRAMMTKKERGDVNFRSRVSPLF